MTADEEELAKSRDDEVWVAGKAALVDTEGEALTPLYGYADGDRTSRSGETVRTDSSGSIGAARAAGEVAAAAATADAPSRGWLLFASALEVRRRFDERGASMARRRLSAGP